MFGTVIFLQVRSFHFTTLITIKTVHTINNGLTPIQEYRTQMFYTVALSEWGSEPLASTYWPTAGMARLSVQQPAKHHPTTVESPWLPVCSLCRSGTMEGTSTTRCPQPVSSSSQAARGGQEGGQGSAGSTRGPALTLSHYSSGQWHGAPDHARTDSHPQRVDVGVPSSIHTTVRKRYPAGRRWRARRHQPLDTISINPMCSLDLFPTDL